jgi:large subunit ribosomal protein L19
MSDEKKTPEAEEVEAVATPEAPKEETKEAAPEAAKATEAVEETTEAAPAAEEAKEEVETEEIPEVPADAEVEELPFNDLRPGMVVRVHEKIKEGQKERVQVFEGLIIGAKGTKTGRTITVRKNSKGWMIEKIFPLSSPKLQKVEVVKEYRVRRAKLNYLRDTFKRKMREVKKDA